MECLSIVVLYNYAHTVFFLLLLFVCAQCHDLLSVLIMYGGAALHNCFPSVAL